MASPPTTSPYTRAVVNAMRRLYPEALADKSFDNTGLLLESPFNPARRQNNSVLLTIDLTKAVADEAIRRKDSIVVAYHPIIFRGLKSLTLKDTQQQSLLRLAAEGISVYSPHTAVDAAKGGLGDWLADIITGEPTSTATSNSSPTNANNTPDTPTKKPKRPTFSLNHYPSQLDIKESTFTPAHHPHKRYPITPTKVSGHDHGGGMGRIIHLDTPVPLPSLLDRISAGLNNPAAFPIAIPQGRTASDITIRSIALCAGSGGGLFSEAEKQGEDVDLYFTGELSHHEALAATEKGKVVVALFHSNSERGFLHAVLKGQLEEAIPEEWEKVRKEEGSGDGAEEVVKEEHEGVFVSEVDRDPYGIMISKTGL